MEESKKGFKRCSKCGRVLPLAFFNKKKSSKDGLQYYCKDCQKAIKNEWRAKNPTYNAEWRAKNPTYNAEWRAKNPTYNAEWYQTHRDSELKRTAERRAKNPTYNAEWRAKNPTYDAEYYQANKEKIAAYNAEYYQANKEKKAAYNAEYYQSNKEKKAEYYQANKDKIAEYYASYYNPQKNPMNWAKRMVADYRQMDRQHGFGDKDTISVDYFIQHIANQPCAHCGKQGIGLIGCNRLDNTKPHTIDNVEPCCQSCNFSQNIRDQIRRGIHVSCKHKKQSFSDFVKEHLNEKSKK